MYCLKCGKQNPDTNHFCLNCGAPLQAQPAPVQPGYGAPPAYMGSAAKKSGAKALKIGLIIGSIVLAAVAVVVAVLLLGGSQRGADTYTEAVDGVMAAYCEGDLDAMLNMMPEKMEDMFSDIPGQRDDMEAQLEEMISERNADYGMGWTVTYYIDEEENITGWDLAELRTMYESYLGMTGIEAAKAVGVSSTIWNASGEAVENEWMSIILIKVEDRWYAMPD